MRNRSPRPREDEWPTYRHNVNRSGRSKFPITTNLKQTWKSQIGGELSSVTVAGGLVFVAQRDRNTVHAIRSADGEQAWRFTAGGTVDSPPTIDSGRVYFGSADGSVYCLRASDGRSSGELESRRPNVVSWPMVESNRLGPYTAACSIDDAAVYCSAGRSSFLDGGINVVKFDAESGQVLTSYTSYDLDPDGKQPPLQGSFDMDGALPDICPATASECTCGTCLRSKETVSPASRRRTPFRQPVTWTTIGGIAPTGCTAPIPKAATVAGG